MFLVFGLVVALASLVSSIIHLGQDPSSYFDFVAMMMVIGGTAATALITMPWNLGRGISQQIQRLVVGKSDYAGDFLNDAIEFSRNISIGKYSYTPKNSSLAQQVLSDGAELINLGFAAEKIDAILKERVYQSVSRIKVIANSVRGLAKYPPAFGLAGTVLGLVHLMHGVSDGVDPKETGIRMAIALIATFYGLLVANLIVNPIGEAIYKNSLDDEKMGEIALQAVLLAAERADLLESQEMLNSFVAAHERVDILKTSDEAA